MEIAKNAIPTLPHPRRLRDYSLNPSAYGVRILRARSARYLGIKKTVVPQLVARGLLAGPDDYLPGLAKLVSVDEVERFAAEYVPISALSKFSQVSPCWVKQCLRESHIPMLDVPFDRTRTTSFLARIVASQIQIPKTGSSRAKPMPVYARNSDNC